MNILITGASGLIGSALIEYLFARGHSFFSLQRNKERDAPFWHLDRIPAYPRPHQDNNFVRKGIVLAEIGGQIRLASPCCDNA